MSGAVIAPLGRFATILDIDRAAGGRKLASTFLLKPALSVALKATWQAARAARLAAAH